MDFGETPNADSLFCKGQQPLQDSDLPKKRSRPLLHGICFLLLFSVACRTLAAPQLASDLTISREGYFVLSWSPREYGELTLQQSSDPDFNTAIEAWDVSGASQFTQSGLFDGDYYFRLLDESGASNTVHVQVQHHSLNRAALFFLLGAMLFGTLVATLVIGHRRLVGGTPQ